MKNQLKLIKHLQPGLLEIEKRNIEFDEIITAFPLKSLEEFEAFEEKLSSDLFRDAFVSFFKKKFPLFFLFKFFKNLIIFLQIDMISLNISEEIRKSVRRIFMKCFTKELALKFVAVSNSKSSQKKVFKNTLFYLSLKSKHYLILQCFGLFHANKIRQRYCRCHQILRERNTSAAISWLMEQSKNRVNVFLFNFALSTFLF